MKKDLHPTYYADAQVICACGNTFTTGSTVKELRVEICSNCHPFYTGKQKLVDTARRVDRFKRLIEKNLVIILTNPYGSSKDADKEINLFKEHEKDILPENTLFIFVKAEK